MSHDLQRRSLKLWLPHCLKRSDPLVAFLFPMAIRSGNVDKAEGLVWNFTMTRKRADASQFRLTHCSVLPLLAQTRASFQPFQLRQTLCTTVASHCRSCTRSPYAAVSLSAFKRHQRDEVDLDCTCSDCSLSFFDSRLDPHCNCSKWNPSIHSHVPR